MKIKPIAFTPREIELFTLMPNVLCELASWHGVQEILFLGVDPDAQKFHAARALELRIIAIQVEKACATNQPLEFVP